MITIIKITNCKLNSSFVSRIASIVIGNTIDSYFWEVGDLPKEGNLQPILDAREDQLLDAAQANGDTFDPLDSRWVRYEVRQFLIDNPNAKLLIKLEPNDLETMIENRNANQETLLLKTLSFATRYIYSLTKDYD